MALIFQRLARNFISNGYFPTDEVTLGRILQALDIEGSDLRILDPCCGEGTALAEVKHHLVQSGAAVTAYGIEFDAERAWHAKEILDTTAHSDVNDVFVSQRSQGLLFLNPPYGDLVSDKASTGDRLRSDRLEKVFYRKTVAWLQFGGVMVLIVPHYVLDKEFAGMIASHFFRRHEDLNPVDVSPISLAACCVATSFCPPRAGLRSGKMPNILGMHSLQCGIQPSTERQLKPCRHY